MGNGKTDTAAGSSSSNDIGYLISIDVIVHVTKFFDRESIDGFDLSNISIDLDETIRNFSNIDKRSGSHGVAGQKCIIHSKGHAPPFALDLGTAECIFTIKDRLISDLQHGCRTCIQLNVISTAANRQSTVNELASDCSIGIQNGITIDRNSFSLKVAIKGRPVSQFHLTIPGNLSIDRGVTADGDGTGVLDSVIHVCC